MKMNYKYMAAALLSVLSTSLFSQEELSLEGAIQKALESNLQIKVQKNVSEVADNNVHIGNAGLLPTVNASGAYNMSVTSSQQVFAGNIPPVDVDAAGSETISASANLNYTLFNGLSGINNFAKLKINKQAADAQSRAAIEGIILQVCQAYLTLQRSQDQLEIMDVSLRISQDRYNRAQVAFDLGGQARTELLSAQVALTADSATWMQANLAQETNMQNLSRLLGQHLPNGITTVEDELLLRAWTLEELQSAAEQNNAGYQQSMLQRDIAEKDLSIQMSAYIPSISLNAGYGYSKNTNDVGILLENSSLGPNGGLSISVPIFNGMRNNVQRQNLKIALENAELLEEDALFGLQADITNAYMTYTQNVKLHLMENANLEAAQLNLERNEEMFKAGQITETQFRQAQLNLVSTLDRISAARVNVLLSELQILQLTGSLIAEN